MPQYQHEGNLEYTRFQNRRAGYYEGLAKIKALEFSFEEILEHYPSFVGHMTISRFLGLYELYKQTLGVAGHIAEVGVYNGASFFHFAKLIQIFESESLTQVHGFDWFAGTGKDEIVTHVKEGTYKESYERIIELVRAQKLENLAFIHKMNVITDLKPFLDRYLHLQFKLIFLDAGMYNVVKTVLPLLWERLTPGGILILDQYNHELSPGETLAVREILPNAHVKTLPNIWMPSAYIIKE